MFPIRAIFVAMVGCLLAGSFAQAGDPDAKNGASRFLEDFHALRKECDARLNSVYKKMEQALDAAIASEDVREEERLAESLSVASDAIFSPAVPKAARRCCSVSGPLGAARAWRSCLASENWSNGTRAGRSRWSA
jgi:hypothetical protein